MTKPLVQLTFYPDAILCTRYDGVGQSTYPVEAQDVADVVADLPLMTGWLPPRTLFVGRRGGETTVAIHVPAAQHTVHVETAQGEQQWSIPMPDLLFMGRGHTYHVFATKTTPAPEVPLFHAPCSNVFDRGSICAGNTPFPEVSTKTIHTAFHLFMSASVFNTHLCKERVRGKAAEKANVLVLWKRLASHPDAPFPLQCLKPFNLTAGTLLRQSAY